MILYGLLMAFIFFDGILFGGFTNLTGEAREELASLHSFLANGVFALGAACAVLAWKASPGRALLAAALLIWKNLGTATWQSGVILDTALLTSLACVDTERHNGTSWLITHLVYAAILAFLLQTGRVTEVMTAPSKFSELAITGRSFGMGHPNSIAILIFSTWLMIWYLMIPQKWWLTILFFWAGGLLIFWLTLCRTVAALLAVFPLIPIVLGPIARSRKPGLLKGLSVLPLLVITLTVIIGMSYSSLTQYFQDGAFWMRFQDFTILQESGLTLFGANPVRFGYFDNFYIWMLMYCGLVPTAAVLVMYIWMIYTLARDRRADLLAIALLFLFYGLMENAVAYAFYFFVPLLAFAGSFRNDPAPEK